MRQAVLGVLAYWAVFFTLNLPVELYLPACTLWLLYCWVLHEQANPRHQGRE